MLSKQRLKSIDIGIFYGIRILLNIAVLLAHTIILSMNFTLHSSTNMMNNQHPDSQVPLPWSSITSFVSTFIGSLFSWILHAVDVFHFMSAFLCTYQLYIMNSSINTTSSSLKAYALFFVNRLLRLYPIYMLVLCYTYFHSPTICHSSWHIIKSLLFIDNFWDHAVDSGCSGIGWSLSKDIQTFMIIMILFYTLYPKNIHILKYILYAIFAITWCVSIVMFHVYCMPYMQFDADGNVVSVLKQGIDLYDPNQLRSIFIGSGIDPYKYIDKNIYDPNNLNADQWRNIMLNNNYITSQYIATYTHLGSGLLGCISAISLLEIKSNDTSSSSSSYWTILKFMVFGFVCSVLSSLVRIYNHHLSFFHFSNSIFSSVLLGSCWNLQTLTVFCGFNIWLRVNNRFLNKFFNNGITRFLSKYTFGIYMVSDLVTSFFVANDDFRRSISVPSQDEETGQILMSIFSKSIVSSFSIAVVLYYVVEYPFIWFRKQYIFNSSDNKILKEKTK